MKREIHFKFKELNVWQKALDFSAEVIKTTENINNELDFSGSIEQIRSSKF